MKEFKFTIDGQQYTTTVTELEGNKAEVTVNGKTVQVTLEQEASTPSPSRAAVSAAPRAAGASAGSKNVVSPLPGSVIKVLVSEGQKVKRGETLLTLESMKMENTVASDYDGTVSKVLVTPGQNVMQDDVLVVIAAEGTVEAPAPAPAPKPAPAPTAAPAPAAAPKPAASAPAGGKNIVSPLPGSVIKVLVTEGQTVKKGDTLLTLESMKMENTIASEFDGVVSKILVSAGQNVMQDDVLVVIG